MSRPQALTAADLEAAVARRVELPRDVVRGVLDALAAEAAAQLAEGRDVHLPGLGALRPRPPRLRRYRSPTTGELETTTTRGGVAFRPKEALRTQVGRAAPDPDQED